jgi:hypothetical protein
MTLGDDDVALILRGSGVAEVVVPDGMKRSMAKGELSDNMYMVMLIHQLLARPDLMRQVSSVLLDDEPDPKDLN